MAEDWARPGTPPALTELPQQVAPRRLPAWAMVVGAFALGVVGAAALFGMTGLLADDGPTALDVQAAYDRGLAAGEREADAGMADALVEAERAAYARGWRAGGLAANPNRASAFEISPLNHFAIPLSEMPASWLAACPAAVPTLLLVLAGVDGCHEGAPSAGP